MKHDSIFPTRRRALSSLLLASGGLAALPMMSSLSACSPAVEQALAPTMDVIDIISEMIIPATDTPGAMEAGVPAYIKAVVGTHFSNLEREQFQMDMRVFDQMAMQRGAKSFLSADLEVRTDILQDLDNSPATQAGHRIWQQIKQMTVFGYYTSEVAADELNYDPVPGEYDGDANMADIGRAWLTTGI